MPTVINSYLQDGAKSWLLTLISQFHNERKFLPCPRQLDFPFPPGESASEINTVYSTSFIRVPNSDVKLFFVAGEHQIILPETHIPFSCVSSQHNFLLKPSPQVELPAGSSGSQRPQMLGWWAAGARTLTTCWGPHAEDFEHSLLSKQLSFNISQHRIVKRPSAGLACGASRAGLGFSQPFSVRRKAGIPFSPAWSRLRDGIAGPSGPVHRQDAQQMVRSRLLTLPADTEGSSSPSALPPLVPPGPPSAPPTLLCLLQPADPTSTLI